MGAPIRPVWEQNGYAFYSEGTESGSTIIGTADNQQTIDTGTIFQCRLHIEEIADPAANKAPVLTTKLQYNHEGGGWNDVGTTTPIQYAASTPLASTTTTSRLGSGTFETGNVYEAVNNLDETDGFAELLDTYTECLYSLKIDAAQVADGDEILLRAVEGVGTLFGGTYLNADIDVNEVAGSTTYDGLADFTGAGSLTGTGAHNYAATAAFDGVGSLSASGAHNYAALADFAGTGALTASGARVHPGVADFTGTGSFTGTGAHNYAALADFAGAGSLSTSGAHNYAALADFAGTGSLTGTGEYIAAATGLRYHLATYDPDTYLVGDELVSGTPTFVHTSTIYAKCSDGYYHSFSNGKRVVKNGRYVDEDNVYADNGSGVLLDPMPMVVYQPAAENIYTMGNIISDDDLSKVAITTNSTNSTRNSVEASHFAANTLNTSHYIGDNSLSFTSGLTYTFRTQVKSAEVDWMQFAFGSAAFTATAYINFNANTGSFGNSAEVTNETAVDINNGWWLVTFQLTASSTATTFGIVLGLTDDTDTTSRLPVYVGDSSSGMYWFGAETYADSVVSDLENVAPIITTGTSAATDEVINTYPSANWSNSEGPIQIIHDYKGVDVDIILNDDVAILYVTSDVMYLDDGTNTTSIAYATEGENKIGIALDETNGFMRLNVNGTWAD